MVEKSIIKQRILQYIDSKGISKYEFYRRSGISKGVLEQYTGMGEKNILRFIDYDPEINLDWLLRGKGEMYRKPVASGTVASPPATNGQTSTAQHYELIEELDDLCTNIENAAKSQIDALKLYKRSLNKLKK